MMRAKNLALVIAFSLVSTFNLDAQEVSSVFSDRVQPLEVPADILTGVVTTADEAERTSIDWYLSPVAFDAANADGARAEVGTIFGFSAGRSLRAGISYQTIGLDSGGDIETLGAKVVYRFLVRERTGLFAIASYSDSDEVGRRSEVKIRGDWVVLEGITLSTTAGFARKHGNDQDLDDFILSPGLTVDLLPKLSVGADYTFDNDVDGEKDYSFAISWQITGPLNVTLIGGQDDLVAISAFVKF